MVVDLLLSARLGLLFDLGFVTLSLFAAIAVRPGDFFVVSVLPPLAMLAVVVLLAAADPGSVAHARDGVVQATVSGLSTHAVALAVGYALCLAVLGVRRRVDPAA
ncbi:DUF6542 domain-containing protein [Nocardioides sp. TF02-7]|uniref:DUF6542 domain-containing protein n=1 Tax=Nocardioides sp. TF02-7 TaxID=2917724 RepID=UPI001F05819C|nr:DUF6542 domain-containing protein [Nocardioides sp. TF02-7]UMG93408.1 hypothetical protein MF408_03955 [Nocardioides sp. TF02-7]